MDEKLFKLVLDAINTLDVVDAYSSMLGKMLEAGSDEMKTWGDCNIGIEELKVRMRKIRDFKRTDNGNVD